MKNPIIMHINYAEVSSGNGFGRKSIADVCRFAAELGYQGIEFRGWVPTAMGDLSFRDYAEQIALAKKNYGDFEVLFRMMVQGASSPDKTVRDAIVAETVEHAKIVREVCGANICNTTAEVKMCKLKTVPSPGYEFNGSAAATDEIFKLTADTYGRIGQELEKINLRFAFETHMNYIHDLPVAARRLVDMIDSPMVGINLDYGNIICFPERPTLDKSIDICGDKLFYVHMKNSVALPGTNARLHTALGEGEINHRLYLEKLLKIGYSGPICIEAPRAGDRNWYAKSDLAYFKDVVADMA